MMVEFIWFDWLVSMNLKNTILNFYREIVLTDIAATVVNLVIEGRNEVASELRIAGYEQLETIEILSDSLQNVHMLIITNNPLLKSVVCGKNACELVMKVELSSLLDLIQFIRSSSINNIHYRMEFILWNNFIEFDQFDWFDSTHSIFLN